MASTENLVAASATASPYAPTWLKRPHGKGEAIRSVLARDRQQFREYVSAGYTEHHMLDSEAPAAVPRTDEERQASPKRSAKRVRAASMRQAAAKTTKKKARKKK